MRSENPSVSLSIPCPHLPPPPQLSGGRWEDSETLSTNPGVYTESVLPEWCQELGGSPGEVCQAKICSRLWQMDGLCSRNTWARESGATPWPRCWLSSLQSLWQALSSREALAWPGLGWLGRKEEQELAQTGPRLAACVITDPSSAPAIRKSQNSPGCVERDIRKPDLSARRACGTG